MVNLDGVQNVVAVGGVWMWVAIIITCVLFGWWILRAGKESPAKTKYKPVDYNKNSQKYQATKAEVEKETSRIEDINEMGEANLGPHNPYPAIVVRWWRGLPAVDFTHIPKPVGHMINMMPSLKVSGDGSMVVIKKPGGTIEDYDGYKDPYEFEKSPVMCAIAVFCADIVKGYWQARIPWWKTGSTILAILMIFVTFILGLVVIG